MRNMESPRDDRYEDDDAPAKQMELAFGPKEDEKEIDMSTIEAAEECQYCGNPFESRSSCNYCANDRTKKAWIKKQEGK